MRKKTPVLDKRHSIYIEYIYIYIEYIYIYIYIESVEDL